MEDCCSKHIRPIVLTRGVNSDSSPIPSLAKFEYYVHKRAAILKQGLEDLGIKEEATALMRYSWRFIMDRRNTIIVGTDNNLVQNRLAYLVPVIGELLVDPENHNRLEGKGPLALIVTSGYDSGRKIEELLECLFDKNRYHNFDKYDKNARREDILDKMIPFHEGACSKNRIDLALCTADGLMTLHENSQHRDLLYFDRLVYLIFDDADILLKTKLPQVLKILALMKHYATQLKVLTTPLQIILCAKEWTTELEDAYQNICSNPVLLIRDPFQILVFSQIQIKAHLMPSDQKLRNLIELLKNKEEQTQCTFILSKDVEQCRLIKKTLDRGGVPSKLVLIEDDTYTDESLLHTLSKIGTYSREIIICSDETTRHLTFSRATRLIHFDIPFRKVFGERFYLMWDYIRDMLPSDEEKPKVISYVFLAEEEEGIHNITKYLLKTNCVISSELLDLAQKAKREAESKMNLCDNVKQHGSCHLSESCQYRHFFNPDEFEPDVLVVPQTGEIVVSIVHCHSPSRFTGVVKKYSPIGEDGKRGKWDSYEEKLENLKAEMNLYFEDKKNRIIPASFTPGMYLAFRDRDESFLRGRMTQICGRNINGFVGSIKVYCIDIGKSYTVDIEIIQVLELPQKFISIPPMSIDMILIGLKPLYGEDSYRTEHISTARIETERKTVLAKIQLVSGRIVWVNPMVEFNPDGSGSSSIGSSIKQSFRNRLATFDGGIQIEKLLGMCEEAGISIPQLLKSKEKIVIWTLGPEFATDKENYQWAFMDVNTLGQSFISCEIIVTNVASHEILGVLKKFNNQLQALNTALNQDIEDSKENFDMIDLEFKKGQAVAGFFNECWARAIITKIMERKGESYYQTLFVDQGITRDLRKSELFPLKRKFITQLPFQAISFSIVESFTIKPLKLGRVFITLQDTFEASFEILAMPYAKQGVGDYGIKSYQVILTSDGVDIVDTLIKKGLVTLNKNSEYSKWKKLPIIPEEEGATGGLIDENLTLEEFDEIWDFQMGSGSKSFLSHMGMEPLMQMKDKYEEGVSRGNVRAIEGAPVNEAHSSNEVSTPPILSPQFGGQNLMDLSDVRACEVKWAFLGDKRIILKILVPDIHNCEINLGDNKRDLAFKTISPPGFGFYLSLYGKVAPTDIEVKCYGLNTIIRLKKVMGAEWPRITYDIANYTWLKKDFDSLVVIEEEPEEEEEDEDVYYVPVDDEDTSGDDNEEVAGDFIEDDDDEINEEGDEERNNAQG